MTTDHLYTTETTYLDHAGATLYPSSLISAYCKDLQANLFGNPHSGSPSSHLSSTRVDNARRLVLNFFDADPASFDVIFTANATAAVKLVREAFVSSGNGYAYGYHRDCHTSIVGMRESATEVNYFDSDEAVESWIQSGDGLLDQPSSVNDGSQPLQLFAYPAQSNLSGHRCPLTWPAQIRKASKGKIYTLLDAASYLTTGRLSLNNAAASPDYICLSFYKIFGFPDLGALIVNKTTGAAAVLADTRLKRDRIQGTYYGGGTVDMIINSSVKEEAWFAMKSAHQRYADTEVHAAVPPTDKNNVHEILEDGTLPLHLIIALEHAFRIQGELFGNGDHIRKHIASLMRRLYGELSALRWDNGRRVVEIYKDRSSTFGNPETQGSILAFNILDAKGGYAGKSQVERAAIAAGIQLRTGGVCNPGGIATHLHLRPWEMRRNFSEGMRCGDDLDVLGGKATGIARVSLGPMSCMKDVTRFVQWVKWWYVEGQHMDSVQSERRPTKWDVGEGLGLETRSGLDVKIVQEQKIEAIEGLKPVEVLRRRDEGNPRGKTRTTYEALKVWEKEWVIVSTENNAPVEKSALANARLKAKLLPENGVLRIVSDVPNGRPGKREEVDISLWDPPPIQILGDFRNNSEQAARRDSACNIRRIDPYPEPHLAQFFSSALGVPCTLARYRSRLLHRTSNDKKEWKCTKAGCVEKFAAEEELREHYKWHVEAFKHMVKYTDTPGSPEPRERPRWRTSATRHEIEPTVRSQSRSRSRVRARASEVIETTSLRVANGFRDLSETASSTISGSMIDLQQRIKDEERKKERRRQERDLQARMEEETKQERAMKTKIEEEVGRAFYTDTKAIDGLYMGLKGPMVETSAIVGEDEQDSEKNIQPRKTMLSLRGYTSRLKGIGLGASRRRRQQAWSSEREKSVEREKMQIPVRVVEMPDRGVWLVEMPG